MGKDSVTICRQINDVSNLVRKEVNSALACCELTGTQLYILNYVVLEGRKRVVYQKDIKRYIKVSRASMAGDLMRMEEKGLILRYRADTDARLAVIKPTDKGTELVYKANHYIEQMEESIRDWLSEEEVEQFIRISSKIIEWLENSNNRRY